MTALPSSADHAPLDAEAIRQDFPNLLQEVNGKPLAYLDSAASAQRPLAVIEAVDHYERHCHANVHRGVHTLSQRATDAYEGAREQVRRFVNASSDREIVFVRGTTEAINLVAQSYARPRLGKGDEILVTRMEHHSNIVPWQMVCEQTGARLVVADIDDRGVLDLDDMFDKIGPRTRIVAVGHVSNALGTINPVREITARAHAAGAVVVVDGAQAAPHVRVDVRDLDVDFYAFSAHKMCGPTGIGALYARRDLLEEMPPWQGGGEMILAVDFERTVYNEVPFKFEAGTPNISGAVGFGRACEYLDEIGLDAIARHEHDLLQYAMQRLAADDLRVIGTAPDKAGVISFTLGRVHPHDIGTILDGAVVAGAHGHAFAVEDRADVMGMDTTEGE